MKLSDSILHLPRRLQPLRRPLDLTALIDIVLLLLIFFLLNSAFVLQPGIRVDPPRSLFEVGAQANPLIVTIVLRGADVPASPLPHQQNLSTPLSQAKPLLFFNDQLHSLAELEEAFHSLPASRLSQPLILKADKEVPLGIMIDLMNMAMSNGLSVIIETQPPHGPSYE